MQKKLSDLRPGEKGKVIKLLAEGKIKRRLFDMGVTPGAQVIMKKTAPLGDPIEINIRGYELSLRKEDARNIVLDTD